MLGTYIRRWAVRGVVLAATALILAAATGCGGSDDADAPATIKDPDAMGMELTGKFMSLLQKSDVNGLEDFLSEAFIIQRADGSTSTKDAYLKNLPKVGQYSIGDVTAVQDGPALAVRWSMTVDEVINGAPYSGKPAPRLTTFVWSGDEWRLIAHANFNAPPATPAASGQ